jgi:hypothetical protein
MSVSFSYGNVSSDFNWSNWSFNSFRKQIAHLIGMDSFDLSHMQGFGGDVSWTVIEDDISHFLGHQNWEKGLSPLECAKIYPRLEEIILLNHKKFDDSDLTRGLALSLMMRKAFENNETLFFC